MAHRLVACAVFFACSIALARPAVAPPVAKKEPHVTFVHDERRVDEYRWMHKKDDPALLAYLKAENAYTESLLAPTAGLQKTLFEDLIGRIDETDSTVPLRDGDFEYYTRTEKGKQYPIYCRKHVLRAGAAEEILLDLNELGKGQAYVSVGAHQVSDDSNLYAYLVDYSGFRRYTLRVKDLRTGQLLPDAIDHATDVAWAADNKTLFYGLEDASKRSWRVMRHTLGADPKTDAIVYEDKDSAFSVGVERLRSRAYLAITSGSTTMNETLLLRADQPASKPVVFLPRKKDQRYGVDHQGDRFLVVINDKGPNFRLVSSPTNDTRAEKWTELMAHDPATVVESVDAYSDHWVVSVRRAGLRRLVVHSTRGGAPHEIEFPDADYALYPVGGEYRSGAVRYAFASPVTPYSVYDYDLDSRQRRLLKQQRIAKHDAGAYVSERLFAPAADGTPVPYSVTRKRSVPLDGKAPVLLSAYGAYGISSEASFSLPNVQLLERGWIFVKAHVRGGGELGRTWHDAGRMHRKRNTFTDLIAVAESLIKGKYASAGRIVIMGGSAGGLTVGAALNFRPDLWKAVFMSVPFVDVIDTMLDASLPLTSGEFEEWGNPRNEEDFIYMKSYSPYDNLGPRDYPTVFAYSSLNDSQVMYFEPAKFIARLRAYNTGKSPIMLRMNLENAGHGGRSGRYDAWHEQALFNSFYLWLFGNTK